METQSQRNNLTLRKKNNCIYMYIPSNLDLEKIFANSPPQIDSFHPDVIKYLCGLITGIATSRKDFDIEALNGYTPINKELLQKNGVHNYRAYLDYMIASEIVEESRQYIVDKQSRGLRFTKIYRSSPLKRVAIFKGNLVKKHREREERITKKAKETVPYLLKWWDEKLKIDNESAMKYLVRLYIEESKDGHHEHCGLNLRYRLLPIKRILHQEYLFVVDSKAGRLHTLLTQLKSELRKFITYDGKKMVNVDIVNSQLYLATALLNESQYERNGIGSKIGRYNKTLTKEPQLSKCIEVAEEYSTFMLEDFYYPFPEGGDVSLFFRLVREGEFYEYFGAYLKEHCPNLKIGETKDFRKLAKECTFKSLFSRNSSIGFSEEMRAFSQLFPSVYEVFQFVKRGQDQHPALALTLQNLESDLILRTICKRISEERPDVPLFTIHDSIVTTEGNEEYVKTTMGEVLAAQLDVAPQFKIERWE